MTRNNPATLSAFSVLRLVLSLLLLAGLGVMTALALGRYFEVREVALPDVVGLPHEEAVRVLERLGLEPVTYSQTSPEVAVEAVVSQSPSAGTVVREGRGVSLGINEATDGIRVPELTGTTEAQARATLEDVVLELGEVRYVFDEAPEGQIIAQQPATGEVVGVGSTISVEVSRGPEMRSVKLPDLRGLHIDEAKRRLDELGFATVDTLASSVSFDRPLTVTDQLPQPDEEAPLSSRVTLFYSLSTEVVVEVPDLSGMSLGRSQLMLRGAGLSLGGISYIDDPDEVAGVVSFEPDGYALRETPVSVVVNRSGAPASLGALEDDLLFTDDVVGQDGGGLEFGDDPGFADVDGREPAEEGDGDGAASDGARAIRFDFDPGALGMTSLQREAYKLTVVVRDDRGERTVLEETVAAGETVNTTIEVYGEALLQTFLNDIFFQAWNP